MFELLRLGPPLGLCALLAGCAADGAGTVRVGDTVSWRLSAEVPGVVTVSWEGIEAARIRVEYGPDERYDFTTALTDLPAVAHEVDLLGMPFESDWHFRVVDADGLPGPDQLLRTADTPADVPAIELLESDGQAWGGWTIAAFGWTDRSGSGVMILDPEARPVWCWTEINSFIPWVDLTADARSAVFLGSDGGDVYEPAVVSISLDGHRIEAIPAPGAHHAVTQPEIPGVRFTYLGTTVQEWEGGPVVGDLLIEVGDDGVAREVWNAFDHLEVVRNEGWENGIYDNGADWTHANGIDYDAADDAYVLSLYHIGAIIKIARSTGEVLWTLGGADSDFFITNDRGFSHQHAPEIDGDTLALFDNGEGLPTRAVRYRLDTEAWTAVKEWEWETPEGSRTTVLGDVDTLPGGQFLTAWGDVGQVNISDEAGGVHDRWDAEPGAIIGKAARFESLYP